MDMMIKKLQEAAMEGSVTTLLEILRQDPLILDRQMIDFYTETPLHVAAMLGHAEFAKEILARKPELAGERNSPQKSTPLHLAAAKGYVEIAKLLLMVDPDMCLARDRYQRNPVHIAAMKGRIGVLKELIKARPQAACVVADHGENILHLCVKHDQLEALKVLVETMEEGDREFLNSRDDDGNTILHLAVADKQIETIKFLIKKTEVDVNAKNANGYTALDILAQSRRDVNDMVIGESLQNVGALGTNVNQEMALQRQLAGKKWENDVQNQEDWLEKKRSGLMVVASLMATMAFQAGVNPPGGVWQDELKYDNLSGDFHTAGSSIMAYKDASTYNMIVISNTTSLITSLSIMFLLISGLSIRRRSFMCILMATMWIAITSTALTYAFSIPAITPHILDYRTFTFVMYAWIGLMGLLVLGHAVRIKVKLIRSKRSRIGNGRSNSMILNHGIV